MREMNEHEAKVKLFEARVDLFKTKVELFKTVATFGFAVALMFYIGSLLILALAPGLDSRFGLVLLLAGIAGFVVTACVFVCYFMLHCKNFSRDGYHSSFASFSSAGPGGRDEGGAQAKRESK